MTAENKTRPGTEFIASACNCGNVRLKQCGGRVVVTCPCEPPYFQNTDGTREIIKPGQVTPCTKEEMANA